MFIKNAEQAMISKLHQINFSSCPGITKCIHFSEPKLPNILQEFKTGVVCVTSKLRVQCTTTWSVLVLCHSHQCLIMLLIYALTFVYPPIFTHVRNHRGVKLPPRGFSSSTLDRNKIPAATPYFRGQAFQRPSRCLLQPEIQDGDRKSIIILCE